MLTRHETIARSRREFLECSALGFGGLAASCILARDGRAATARNPLAAKDPPLDSKARSVIFLFMHGGPSHLDTFDPKPLLQKHDGQPVPESFRNRDFQFTRMDRVPLLAPRGHSPGTESRVSRFPTCSRTSRATPTTSPSSGPAITTGSRTSPARTG